MGRDRPGVALALFAVLPLLLSSASAEIKKEFHYSVSPHASLVVANESGPIAIKAGGSGQVNVIATLHSDRVEVDAAQHGNRVELYTHPLQKSSPQESRVDYAIELPPDASIDVRDASGAVQIDGVQGAITIEGDAAEVSATNIQDSHLRVRTLSGPVILDNVHDAEIEVVSVTGPVSMQDADGTTVSVNTTSGPIECKGAFVGGGSYSLTSHTGDITLTIPENAAVDLSARSVKGTVDNELPLNPKSHVSFPVETGRSYAGTSTPANLPALGMPTVSLRSFSGKIHVKKQ
jgi:hypothetical protein